MCSRKKNVYAIDKIISILKQEFCNLNYVFLLEDISDRKLVEQLCSSMEIEGDIMTLEEYFDRIESLQEKVFDTKNYFVVDGRDNVYLELVEEKKKDIEEDKNFVNYNGYNEY